MIFESYNQDKWNKLGEKADMLFRELFPLCRSITGKDVRKSLSILQQTSQFKIESVPSGTKCFDWEIPREWNLKRAYIRDSTGHKVVDTIDNNLHVINYSRPFSGNINFQELRAHIHTMPDFPDAIPYRTTYYNDDWGFCMSHNKFKAMDINGTYEVLVDTEIAQGELNYGHRVLQGSSGREFLFSTYCCHPSMANDNLSGIILWSLLLSELSQYNLRHSYRFVIAPETIGAICYLWRYGEEMRHVEGGWVITTVAGPAKMSFKETFSNDSLIDYISHQALSESVQNYKIYEFDVLGSDERQYSSPFFRIPMGSICKDKYFEYDYYHTSKDDLSFANHDQLVQTLKVYLRCVDLLERDCRYHTKIPCEPMLGKRGLWHKVGGGMCQKRSGQKDEESFRRLQHIVSWLLFFGDGSHSLLEISKRSGYPIEELRDAVKLLESEGLVEII